MGLITTGIGTYGSPTRRGNANTVTIGKYCSIAEGVIIDSGFNHRHDFVSTYPFNRLFPEIKSNIEPPENIVIGNDVWIGEGVLIMAGVRIYDGAVIGARSVITKNTVIPHYEIWAGIPAIFKKSRFGSNLKETLIISKLKKLKWWDLPENEIREIAPLLMSNDFEKLFKLYNL